jgi:Gram-negative bacterial TonB protein C-terminal
MTLKPALVAALTFATICCAQDKGYCPPSPPPPTVAAPKKVVPPAPPTPDVTYFGTVTLLTVISDKGYVCSARVLQGINKEIDKKTEKKVREWRLDPARKDGRAVPVVVTIAVNYWATSTGEIVSDPPHPPSSPQSEEKNKKD